MSFYRSFARWCLLSALLSLLCTLWLHCHLQALQLSSLWPTRTNYPCTYHNPNLRTIQSSYWPHPQICSQASLRTSYRQRGYRTIVLIISGTWLNLRLLLWCCHLVRLSVPRFWHLDTVFGAIWSCVNVFVERWAPCVFWGQNGTSWVCLRFRFLPGRRVSKSCLRLVSIHCFRFCCTILWSCHF